MNPLCFVQVLLCTFQANTAVCLLKCDCEVSHREFNLLVLKIKNVKMWLLNY
jgi:hypothetical protein